MGFINYTKKLNEIAINKQKEKESELLTEEDIIKAITYLNYMLLEDTGDCLIFLSALNLCNAYVKQNNSKITYSFKKCIEYFIDTINNRDIKDIYINLGIFFFVMFLYIKEYFKEEDNSSLKDDWNSIKEFFKFIRKDIMKNKKS